MPKSSSVIQGVDLNGVFNSSNPCPQPQLGTMVKSVEDGRDYIFVTATGAIATNASVILTDPAMTIAAGAGSWTWTGTPALAAGDKAWVRRNTL